MKILKKGTEEKVVQCPHCNTIFSYDSYDVYHKDEEFFGEWHYSASINCPVCDNILILKTDDKKYEYPIKIKIKTNNLKTLTGYKEGNSIFEKQVLPYMKYTKDKITIIFPDNIKDVSISFVEGFQFHSNLQHYKFEDKFIIKGTDTLVKNFKSKSLY